MQSSITKEAKALGCNFLGKVLCGMVKALDFAEISPGCVLMGSVLCLEKKAGKQGILSPAIAV